MLVLVGFCFCTGSCLSLPGPAARAVSRGPLVGHSFLLDVEKYCEIRHESLHVFLKHRFLDEKAYKSMLKNLEYTMNFYF